MEWGNEEQMADRHAVASGKDERQHDDDIMRDIHIGKGGSETACEEQPDKLRKTVRFEQEVPSSSSSSTIHVSLEYLARRDKTDQSGFSCRNQIMWTMTNKFCVACGLRYGWTKEPLHQRSVGLLSRRICREHDSSSLNAFQGEIWKSEKSNQKIVMDEKFVKNSMMNATIDPKVVMDLSTFKIDGWNNVQPSNQKLLEEFMNGSEPWLLIGIPNRDQILRDTILGTTLCEFRSTHEEVDVTSLRPPCDDASLHATAFC